MILRQIIVGGVNEERVGEMEKGASTYTHYRVPNRFIKQLDSN